MSRTLKDDVAADLYDVQLNVNEFAEWATFHPATGGSRRVVVLIEHRHRMNEQTGLRYQTGEITVLVGGNESHAKGGVAAPRLKDALRRDGDAEDERYAYGGDGKAIAGGWKLEFSRPRLVTIGTESRRQ